MKLAGAPISWGVCEVPGWGHQLAASRVLAEAARLGLTATEAGPPGFLPADAVEARAALAAHGLRLVGGFVTAVLHDRSRLDAEIAAVDRQTRWLADGGADVLVLAAASGRSDYERAPDLSKVEWLVLLDSLAGIEEDAARAGLVLAVHPHVGTAIESRAAIERLIERSSVGICLDTGHVYVGGADPTAIANAAPRRIRHVHLKDADATLAAAVRERRIGYGEAVRRGLYRPLGDGEAGIADVLEALQRHGYEGWAVLEQDVRLADALDDPSPSMARSLAFARARVA